MATADSQVDALVRALELIPHPEGGFYRETFRSPDQLEALPSRFGGGARSASTAIYYLLRRGDFSALHRIQSDEVWHFYAGSPLVVSVLHGDGRLEEHVLGTDLAARQRPQAVVPPGVYFGSRLLEGSGQDFALVGCTVAPGFDFADFELGAREELLVLFPEHRETVLALTR